jgi:fructokinase
MEELRINIGIVEDSSQRILYWRSFRSKSLSCTIVAYGEILWDLLPSSAVLGGAPFNFIYRVNSLGHRGLMVSRLGNDELGDRALAIVKGLALETGYLQRDRDYPTGTVEVSFDEQRNPDYRIIPNVAYDFIDLNDGLRKVVAQADCLCFGTLIQRQEVSRKTLYELLGGFFGRFVLLDINLRRDCYTRESILESITHADILKLNDAEADHLAEIYGMDRSEGGIDLSRFAENLLGRSNLKFIVVTLGERGAFAVSRDGEKVYHPAFSVRLRDSVGSGDAFTAGFVDALLNDQSLPLACRYGNALGAVVAAQVGATKPLDRLQVDTFLETAELGPIEKGLKEFLVS